MQLTASIRAHGKKKKILCVVGHFSCQFTNNTWKNKKNNSKMRRNDSFCTRACFMYPVTVIWWNLCTMQLICSRLLQKACKGYRVLQLQKKQVIRDKGVLIQKSGHHFRHSFSLPKYYYLQVINYFGRSGETCCCFPGVAVKQKLFRQAYVWEKEKRCSWGSEI